MAPALHRFGRIVRRFNTVSRPLEPGRIPLPIGRLASPLRYDIVVRERFFEAIHEHADDVVDDVESALELAEAGSYAVWFRAIAFSRIKGPEADEAELHDALRERVRRTVELYRAYIERGFDSRYPVSIRLSDSLRPTVTGKALLARPLPLDGCHRIALLRWSGRTTLEPGEYVVRRDRSFQPPDNTDTLLRCLSVSLPEYLEYFSWGYFETPLSDEADVRAHLELLPPALADEARSVLDHDLPLLARPAKATDEAPAQA